MIEDQEDSLGGHTNQNFVSKRVALLDTDLENWFGVFLQDASKVEKTGALTPILYRLSTRSTGVSTGENYPVNFVSACTLCEDKDFHRADLPSVFF